MSMKTKVGDVVRLDTTYWSYSGKLTAGHIGVVTALHPHSEFGKTWINIDGEDGAPHWNPEDTFTVLESTGTLFEDMFDDMRDGDVLVATSENYSSRLTVGNTYTAHAEDCGCCFYFEDDNDNETYCSSDDFFFINLSAVMRDNSNVVAFPTDVKTVDIEADPMFSLTTAGAVVSVEPSKYDDLNDEAKGALLLAHHEGKPIQYLSTVWNEWYDDNSFDPSENFAYRVKPQELIDAEADVEKVRDNVISMSEARDAMQDELDAAYLAYSEASEAMNAARLDADAAEAAMSVANARVAELRAA